MAFSGEAEVLTWQRVEAALRTQPIAAGAVGPSPGAQMQFFALKRWLAQHKLAPQLQFVAFDRTTNGSDGTNAATVIVAGAGTLYGVYARKYTGTTLGYWTVSNHATAIQAQKEVLLAGTVASVEVCVTYLSGLAFATGITYSGVTAYNGTTRSLIADSWDGFAIIGA